MSFLPPAFRALADGWSLRAVSGPVPEHARAALAAGVPAVVPGEAHLDLQRAGLIADPFDGDNESAQQWIGDTSWRYSTTFAWEPGGAARHDLVAFGLDTVATVEVNGVVVGRTENMHRTYRFDLRDVLHPGQNMLTVSFAAPVPEVAARAERRGDLPHDNAHAYNQLRKMACSFGWNWGVDVAGAGIWRPIGLDEWSDVRIASVRPLVGVVAGAGGDEGTLDVHVEIERDGVDADVPLVLSVTAPAGEVRITATGVIPAGTTTGVVSARVPRVERWWPVGHGRQPLYRVAVEAGATGRWEGRVGFRTVELDTTPDASGAPFVLKVNGEAVLVRGVNWIPDHAFLTQVDRERYGRRLDDALEANANLVRVWGGGVFESDEFYDLADERGLLVWQDFLFACAAYSEEEPLRSEVEAEARENIARLSPHPSLVLWNGANENIWAFVDWGWQPEIAGRTWGDGYYRELLPALLAELDPTRPYSPASPYSFGDYLNPNDERYGTVHIWDLMQRADYTDYRKQRPRFVSEFGFQGPPSWSTLTGAVHDEPLDPFGPQMLIHQKFARGNEELERGWTGHLPTPRSIEDWHWSAQLNQAHAIRFGVEHFRSLTPHNTGTILWQLNDNWPVISWSAVDFHEHRKPVWYALRNAYAPRLATFQPRDQDGTVPWYGLDPLPEATALVLVNDTAEPFSGAFTVARQTFSGATLAAATLTADIPARGTASVVVPAEVATFGDPTREVMVAVVDGEGFAPAFRDGADVVAQALDPVPLTVQAHRAEDGYAVVVTASSYARDVFCHADTVDPDARVDEGMVTLRAGQTVTFRVTSDVDVDPRAFAAALRCANDLCRTVVDREAR